jgi:TIR domain
VNGRDPHSAPKSEVTAKANRSNIEAVVARLQWRKDDVGYSLHVNPSSFTSAGIQKTDFLAYLGFQRSDRCSFTSFQRCYVKWVSEGFDPDRFLTAFESGFANLERACLGLEACGFSLPQSEGWAFYYGKSGGHSQRGPTALSCDGHTARQTRRMKQTEDDTFLFRFSFIETDSEKGFVTHYRPKHPPLTSELRSVFRYLGLREFQDCPEFDFEPCFYRTRSFESRGDGLFDNNTEYAHRGFDAHVGQFSTGIRDLLAANEQIETFGMTFLPFENAGERLKVDIEQKIIRPQRPAANTIATMGSLKSGVPANFDVAISVAGADKQHALQLAEQLRAAGFAVFYYEFYPEYLWGKNLAITFDEIFRKRSRYCVMFISKEYRDRVWTSHEMRSAQARAVEEKGKEYILPIRIDDTELDGLLPTISYVPIAMGVERIGNLLIQKLQL